MAKPKGDNKVFTVLKKAGRMPRRGRSQQRAAAPRAFARFRTTAVLCLMLGLAACKPNPAPQIAASERLHSFAPAETDWTFQVWNTDTKGGALAFTVSSNQAYIQVTPSAGSSTGVGDKASVKVTVDRNVFAKTDLKLRGLVTVASNAGDITVAIDFTGPLLDKFALWTNSTQLRGANIALRRVYPFDGPTFMGPGPVGPPFTQDDFNRLAALGANCVNISHPGLYTEAKPFVLDAGVQASLDQLIDYAENAGLFVVISARTGPGRSEFTFNPDLAPALVDDSVWTSNDAQNGWVDMWRYTAQRYSTRATVIGYDLMVEPNSNARIFNDYVPTHFYILYGGTLYDWNQLHQRITVGVRASDPLTPILIGSMSYSAASWLPFLMSNGDPRTVYTANMYEPMDYTHQDSGPGLLSYPGVFDADGDGVNDTVNRAWLDAQFAPVDAFIATNHVPVAVNEFGVHRWCPGADRYMDDMISLLEQRGINHALWLFNSSWTEYATVVDDFDFLHGAHPNNHANVTSPLRTVIESDWSRNSVFTPPDKLAP